MSDQPWKNQPTPPALPDTSAGTCSVFRCVGNIGGCDKTGDDRCSITVRGQPPQNGESLYMCPFNHWRSARWEKIPNTELKVTKERSV